MIVCRVNLTLVICLSGLDLVLLALCLLHYSGKLKGLIWFRYSCLSCLMLCLYTSWDTALQAKGNICRVLFPPLLARHDTACVNYFHFIFPAVIMLSGLVFIKLLKVKFGLEWQIHVRALILFTNWRIQSVYQTSSYSKMLKFKRAPDCSCSKEKRGSHNEYYIIWSTMYNSK